MFPRRKRLPRDDFPTGQTRVRRASTTLFSAVVPEKGRGYAVVISKKVLRRAVDRHQLKRRVAAALQTLPLPGALIVYPRAGATALAGTALREALSALVTQIHKPS